MRVTRYDLHLLPLRTRMPFRYGIATMSEVPQCFVRVWVEIAGEEVAGVAADLLPPKWFTKIADQALEAEIAGMLDVIRHALLVSAGASAPTPFELWQQIYRTQDEWGRANNLPPLLVHFGTSLVERAILEAFCRHEQMPFSTLLRSNRLGVQLAELHRDLVEPVSSYLPLRPLPHVTVRHTIGLGDPLLDATIPTGDRLHDGLPQSLAACTRYYGLRHFKIKVSGRIKEDSARLLAIANVLEANAEPNYAFSLDGNEQFTSFGEFRAFWQELTVTAGLEPFWARLLFVEQPVLRSYALEDSVASELETWPHRPCLIIDESDGAIGDGARALELGYAGTSHKNCKGVFKGIANRCLIAHRVRQEPDRSFIMSGEDLCTTGPVALLQDLAVMATLGISSVERNGHHYHAGLSQFPLAMQELVLAHHSDLYCRSTSGWPTLNIQNGCVMLSSVNESPLGVAFNLPLDAVPVVQ